MNVTLDPVAARRDHQQAVRDFLAAARAVAPDRWEHEIDDTTWSPAQIAEHVRLTYEVVGAQFAGGSGLRVRTPWLLRIVLRWRFLGGILQHGTFPAAARAPREIRPGDGPFDRETVLAGLERAAQSAESDLVARWSDPTCVMTHHVFGDLRPPLAMRLATVHTRHHAAQLMARAHAA